MKTKISNILGVGLALLMVFSLAFALVPTKVEAAEGNMQWTVQPLPTTLYFILANNTDVTEIAVASDGLTMYAIDGTEALDGSGATTIPIYLSKDGGQSWLGLAGGIPGALAFPPANIAVAPDNPNVIAVSCFDVAGGQADVAYISTDGGVTWATLPPLQGATGAMRILDLKVGPARGGTIYGRDYMVATADDANTVTLSSLQILGETATWAIVAGADSFTVTGVATTYTVAVTTGSVSLAITTDADSDATIVGNVITLGDAADVATITATADATIGTVTTPGAGAEAVVISYDLDGDAAIGGASPNWTFSLPDGGIAALPADFVACEFSPNFVGDRIVFGVGTTNVPVTSFYTCNVQNYGTTAPTLVHAAVTLDIPAGTPIAATDYQIAVGADSVIIGDIAVPSNFDITPGFERAYASVATSGATGGGVWRCDSVLVTRELGFATTPVRSIAYSGDTANGTLFAGQYVGAVLSTQVWSTAQMTTNLPAWYPSYKPPTGVGVLGVPVSGAYVRLSPNYAADKKVYCGTSGAGAGDESAFNVSTDAGLTFNQKALVDTNDATNDVNVIDGIAYSPDGATLFVATDDTVDLSLWKTATSPSPFSWERIFCFTPSAGYTGGVLAINYATWADAPEIYFAETATVANRLFASYDGGAIFNTRSAPVIGAAINFMSVESSKVLYTAFGGNVFKSTNGGSVWSPPRPALVGAIISVIAAPGGDVLVGGTGSASISTDGGVTFSELPPGLPGKYPPSYTR